LDTTLFQSLISQYCLGCVFCQPRPELLWKSTENFGVCFDVAPLVTGHMIIFSREHHACAGEVPPPYFGELAAVRGDVKRTLRAVWGSVTLYEHGRAGHCLSDGPEHRLCHHFHLHCVPGHNDVVDELADRFEQVAMAKYSDLPDIYAEYGNYLYLETDAGELHYFVVREEIERHLLRTLISRCSGHPERADWREYRDIPVLAAGIERIGDAASTGG
jgi:diadenosine tetraphosphate (Ap4A) HIT family hydrolase